MISVTLRAPSGKVLIDGDGGGALQFHPSDYACKIREAAMKALAPRPGLRCRLLLGRRLLDDGDCLEEDLQMFPGDHCEVLAVLEMEPMVCQMLEHFRETMRVLAEAAGKEPRDKPLPQRSGSESDEGEAPWKQACDELERLGQTAAPAAPFFVDWLDDPSLEIRQVATWALGGLGSEAVPLLSHLLRMLRDDEASVVREESAQALLSVAAAAPAEVLTALSLTDSPLAGEEFWWVRARALRCLQPSPAAVELVPYLVSLVSASCPAASSEGEDGGQGGRALGRGAPGLVGPGLGRRSLCAEAVRALGRVSRKALRRAVQGDLFDEDAWRRSHEAMQQRLHALAVAGVCRAAGRCLDPKLHPLAPKRPVPVPPPCNEDPNSRPFPVRESFDPLKLRQHLYLEHALPSYDPAVPGEAAWRCLESQVVPQDRFVSGLQERRATARAAQGPLHPLILQAKLLCLRRHFTRGGRSARRFFERAERLEGGDPLHAWLFPEKGRPLVEEFEPLTMPRTTPVRWFRRAGPSCLRQLQPQRRPSGSRGRRSGSARRDDIGASSDGFLDLPPQQGLALAPQAQ